MYKYYLEVTTKSKVINIEIKSTTTLSDSDVLDFGFDIDDAKKGKILDSKPSKIHTTIKCCDFDVS